MAGRPAALAALLLALCCSTAMGVGPSWYSCDPTQCQEPDCVCASDVAPPMDGEQLPLEEVPQFIVLTHDDAITATTNVVLRSVIDKHTNRNGCNMPATFFVLKLGTDCALAKAFWEENSELALHTTTHVPLVDPFPGGDKALHDEMFGVRTFLNESCGIPLEDMVGFRTPQLVHNPPVRAQLSKEGMLYDSSIVEYWPSATSPNASYRLWPYTMDDGVPQDCAYFAGSNCTQQEQYRGLWEVPLLETQDKNGTLLFSMDPGLTSGGGDYASTATATSIPAAQLEDLLRTNFDFSYYGNRAPFGIYTHTPWYTPSNVKALNNFLEYALSLNNTWVVTNRQVIAWMQNPVPASEMDDWLTCKPVDLQNAPGVKTCQKHTVKAGDTLSDIATQYGVELAQLEQQNPSITADSLQIGDVLLIPPFPDSCKKQGSQQAAASPTAA